MDYRVCVRNKRVIKVAVPYYIHTEPYFFNWYNVGSYWILCITNIQYDYISKYIIRKVVYQPHVLNRIAETHHFDATQIAYFDAAPAPTLLYNKPTFLKQAKVNISVREIFFLLI
jgi:hypothetical protein